MARHRRRGDGDEAAGPGCSVHRVRRRALARNVLRSERGAV